MTRVVNAAVYARYSTDLQRPESIEDQLIACKREIEKRGLFLKECHIFADKATSGTRKDRVSLQTMKEAAQRGEFSVLYVDDLSRLARDNHLMLTLMAELHYYGVTVVSVADGLDSENEEAKLGFQIRGIFNEMQINDIRKKTLRGMLGQKSRGFSAGERIFGYQSVPVGEIRIDKNGKRRPDGYKFEINQEEARVVLRVFKEFKEGKSIQKLVKELNEEGVHGFNRLPGRWSAATVSRMLDNEKYIGKWSWNKSGNRRDPHTGRVRRVAKKKTEWVERVDESLRIVPKKLWDQVRERRKLVRRVWPGAKKTGKQTLGGSRGEEMYPTHLLSGMLICDACGGTMGLVSGKKGGYYGCFAATRHSCSNRKLVRRSIVEDRILEALENEICNTENYHFIMQELTKKIIENQSKVPKLIAEYQKELKARERKLQNYVNFIAEGRGSKTIGEAIAQEEEKIDEIREDLRQLEHSKGDTPKPSPNWVEERLACIKQTLERKTVASAHLLRDVLGRIELKYKEYGNPKSGYVAHATLDHQAVLITPLEGVFSGSNQFQWRPQGDSNPCCRRERAKS